MERVSGERLAAAIASRRPELWDNDPRLAERIEMRIKDAQRAAARRTAVVNRPRVVLQNGRRSLRPEAELANGAEPRR